MHACLARFFSRPSSTFVMQRKVILSLMLGACCVLFLRATKAADKDAPAAGSGSEEEHLRDRYRFERDAKASSLQRPFPVETIDERAQSEAEGDLKRDKAQRPYWPAPHVPRSKRTAHQKSELGRQRETERNRILQYYQDNPDENVHPWDEEVLHELHETDQEREFTEHPAYISETLSNIKADKGQPGGALKPSRKLPARDLYRLRKGAFYATGAGESDQQRSGPALLEQRELKESEQTESPLLAPLFDVRADPSHVADVFAKNRKATKSLPTATKWVLALLDEADRASFVSIVRQVEKERDKKKDKGEVGEEEERQGDKERDKKKEKEKSKEVDLDADFESLRGCFKGRVVPLDSDNYQEEISRLSKYILPMFKAASEAINGKLEKLAETEAKMDDQAMDTVCANAFIFAKNMWRDVLRPMTGSSAKDAQKFALSEWSELSKSMAFVFAQLKEREPVKLYSEPASMFDFLKTKLSESSRRFIKNLFWRLFDAPHMALVAPYLTITDASVMAQVAQTVHLKPKVDPEDESNTLYSAFSGPLKLVVSPCVKNPKLNLLKGKLIGPEKFGSDNLDFYKETIGLFFGLNDEAMKSVLRTHLGQGDVLSNEKQVELLILKFDYMFVELIEFLESTGLTERTMSVDGIGYLKHYAFEFFHRLPFYHVSITLPPFNMDIPRVFWDLLFDTVLLGVPITTIDFLHLVRDKLVTLLKAIHQIEKDRAARLERLKGTLGSI